MNNDGGPAFPSSNTPDTGYFAEGMTLRDYFAAKALAAILANPAKEDCLRGVSGLTCYPKYAYDWADAMMAARDA